MCVLRNAVILTGLTVLGAASVHAQTPPTAGGAPSRGALVREYCAYCHNDDLKSGGMTLTQLDVAHPERNAALAEKVIRKLRAGLMPPPGMPRPDAAALRAFATSLEAAIDQAAALHPNPGRPALHRLNRTEYANSVRDLLGV